MSVTIQNVVLSVIIAVVVTLGCILLGGILESLHVAIAVTIGAFLATYSGVLGVLAGLWFFFTH
jgi:hypothetical protein